MTQSEWLVLAYLAGKMEANRRMVGEVLAQSAFWMTTPENAASAVLGKLRREGFVTRVPELRAWAITSAGRAALAMTAP